MKHKVPMTEKQALTEAQRRWGPSAKVMPYPPHFWVSSGRLDNRYGTALESWEAAFAYASERDRRNGHDPDADWVEPPAAAPGVRRYIPPTADETVRPERICVPYFELYYNPTLNIKELIEKGKDCVIRNEAMVDGKLVVFAPPTTVGALYAHLVTLLEAYLTVKAPNFFSVDAIADGFSEIEKCNLRVTKVLVNPDDAAAFVKAMSNGHASLEEVTAGAENGVLGMLWGAEVHSDATVPRTRVKLVSETAEGFFGDEPVHGPIEHWV